MLTHISTREKAKNSSMILLRSMLLIEKLGTEPCKVKWWEAWVWILRTRLIPHHFSNVEKEWTKHTLTCKSRFKLSMKIELNINLPLTRRKKNKLIRSELSKRKSLILQIWWTKCPVSWFRTTRTLTNQEKWLTTSEIFFTEMMEIRFKLKTLNSKTMPMSTELYQIFTLLEDHHSTRSRLFRSNSMQLSLTLVTLTSSSVHNLPKRHTIWRTVWSQKRKKILSNKR